MNYEKLKIIPREDLKRTYSKAEIISKLYFLEAHVFYLHELLARHEDILRPIENGADLEKLKDLKERRSAWTFGPGLIPFYSTPFIYSVTRNKVPDNLKSARFYDSLTDDL